MINIFYIDKVDTTMNEIKKYPIRSLVVANEQTNGKGKGERVWQSERSENIYMSLSINAINEKINYSNYTFLTSLSIAKTTIKLTDGYKNISCKWPNDVLINNKKFCGILLERDIKIKSLIVGIGININRHPKINNRISFEPTDLLTEGFIIKRKQFVEEFVKVFNMYEEELETNGFKKIREEWLSLAYNFKKEIIVKLKDEELSGTFEDLDKDGTLILSTKSSKIKIFSGDIF